MISLFHPVPISSDNQWPHIHRDSGVHETIIFDE